MKKEKEIKCQFCNRPAYWITNNVFDIRTACKNHKKQLKREIKLCLTK